MARELNVSAIFFILSLLKDLLKVIRLHRLIRNSIFERLPDSLFSSLQHGGTLTAPCPRAKVGILVHSLPPWGNGGNPREAIQVAAALAKHGIEPTIFYFSPYDSVLRGANLIRMNYIRSPPHTADIFAIWKVVWTCVCTARTHKIDVLLAYAASSSEGLAAPVISKLLGIKSIIRTTGNDVLSDLRRYPFLIKPPLKFADVIVPINDHMKRLILHSMPNTKNKTIIIPIAVDVEHFNPQLDGSRLRRKHGLEGDFVVLTIARLVKIKGVEYLIRAMSYLVKENINAKLIVIGDGPERDNLIALTSKLSLHKVVVFERFINDEDLPYYYAACDVFVLPSVTDENGRTEAFGKVLAEALACGRPVVGTRVGGIPAIIEDGRTGLLVEQRNPKALSDAIIKIKRNPALSAKISENGRKAVIEKYSYEKVMKQWLDLFDAVQ